MPGNNGHKNQNRRNGECLSLRELLRPLVPKVAVPGTSDEDVALPRLDPTKLYELVVLLPLYYNPDENGNQVPVEASVFEKTFAEIRQFSSGYRIYQGGGWGHSLRFRGDFDEHLRVEVDALFTAQDMPFLQDWKQRLTLRFRQTSVYVFFNGPILPL